MNRVKNLIAVFAFSLLILGLPAIASAQWRGNRDNNDYSRNNGYNQNLNSIVKNLKNHSRDFARRLDRELDRSRYDGRRREDNLNNLARSFREAAENLDDEYDNRNDYSRSQDEVRRVLTLGNQLDNAISRARLNSNIQSDWYRVRQDLSDLSNAYSNNNGRNNRNNRNNNRRNNRTFPF